MRCLFLNLPHSVPVIRRYMCSYNSPHFLFPPLELMYLGSIVKNWKHGEVFLVDAIAEGLDTNAVLKALDTMKPDVIITLIGFETFTQDIENINTLKEKAGNVLFIAFGYYPTLFSQEILNNSQIDIIMVGEPELTFAELYDFLKDKKEDLSPINGLAYRSKKNDIVLTGSRNRITDLDILPFPDYSLIKPELYSEILMEKPFAVLQGGRGCPFNCSYCVRTYGRQLMLRSVNNVLSELECLVKNNKICSVRFLDDTFTVDKQRVMQICKGILSRGLNFAWSCLSRIDTIDEEMANSMRQAGCIRVLLGIESGSQRLLDYYQKNYSLEKIESSIKVLKKSGIEAVGWFIVGGMAESEDDFKKSVHLAKRTKLDFIAISKLCLYPGTILFEQLKDNLHFSLFPYRNEFKVKTLDTQAVKREKEFYRAFYLDHAYMIRMLRRFLKNPAKSISLARTLFKYLGGYNCDNMRRKDFL